MPSPMTRVVVRQRHAISALVDEARARRKNERCNAESRQRKRPLSRVKKPPRRDARPEVRGSSAARDRPPFRALRSARSSRAVTFVMALSVTGFAIVAAGCVRRSSCTTRSETIRSLFFAKLERLLALLCSSSARSSPPCKRVLNAHRTFDDDGVHEESSGKVNRATWVGIKAVVDRRPGVEIPSRREADELRLAPASMGVLLFEFAPPSRRRIVARLLASSKRTVSRKRRTRPRSSPTGAAERRHVDVRPASSGPSERVGDPPAGRSIGLRMRRSSLKRFS